MGWRVVKEPKDNAIWLSSRRFWTPWLGLWHWAVVRRGKDRRIAATVMARQARALGARLCQQRRAVADLPQGRAALPLPLPRNPVHALRREKRQGKNHQQGQKTAHRRHASTTAQTAVTRNLRSRGPCVNDPRAQRRFLAGSAPGQDVACLCGVALDLRDQRGQPVKGHLVAQKLDQRDGQVLAI